MSDSPESPQEGELILYQTAAGTNRIEAVDLGETFWLNQKRIATRLSGLSTVGGNLAALDHPGKLSHETTLRTIRRVRPQRSRQVRAALRVSEAILRPGSRRPAAVSTAQSAPQATLQKSWRVPTGQNRAVRRGTGCRHLRVIPPFDESDGLTYAVPISNTVAQRIDKEPDGLCRLHPDQPGETDCERDVLVLCHINNRGSWAVGPEAGTCCRAHMGNETRLGPVEYGRARNKSVGLAYPSPGLPRHVATPGYGSQTALNPVGIAYAGGDALARGGGLRRARSVDRAAWRGHDGALLS
jgi:hypothetical protein